MVADSPHVDQRMVCLDSFPEGLPRTNPSNQKCPRLGSVALLKVAETSRKDCAKAACGSSAPSAAAKRKAPLTLAGRGSKQSFFSRSGTVSSRHSSTCWHFSASRRPAERPRAMTENGAEFLPSPNFNRPRTNRITLALPYTPIVNPSCVGAGVSQKNDSGARPGRLAAFARPCTLGPPIGWIAKH